MSDQKSASSSSSSGDGGCLAIVIGLALLYAWEPLMRLEVEPIELEWRNLLGGGFTTSTPTVLANLVYLPTFKLWSGQVIVTTNDSRSRLDAQVCRESTESARAECERLAGLFLAALGLERPGEKSDE